MNRSSTLAMALLITMATLSASAERKLEEKDASPATSKGPHGKSLPPIAGPVGKTKPPAVGKAISRQAESNTSPTKLEQQSKPVLGAGAQPLPGGDSSGSSAKSTPKTQSKMKGKEQREDKKQQRLTNEAK